MRALKLEMQEQGWPAALLSLSITKPEKLSRFPDLFQCQKGSYLALHPFDFKKVLWSQNVAFLDWKEKSKVDLKRFKKPLNPDVFKKKSTLEC